MPQADQATTDLLTDYFQAMEVKDFDRLGAYYADDITQTSPTLDHHGARHHSCPYCRPARQGQFAGAPVYQYLAGSGRRGDLRGHQHLALQRRHRHQDQRLLDFTIADGKFTDQRIYVDNAPVDRFLV